VPNLTHPGGNITGFANPEFSITGKWADLLKQMAPSIARGRPWPFGPRGTWRPNSAYGPTTLTEFSEAPRWATFRSNSQLSSSWSSI